MKRFHTPRQTKYVRRRSKHRNNSKKNRKNNESDRTTKVILVVGVTFMVLYIALILYVGKLKNAF